MSTTKADTPLVLALAELARTSPRAWSAAVAEIKKHADQVKDQLVSAPVDVLVHQGRARESASFAGLCESCVKEADMILAAHQKKQSAQP